MNLFKEKVVLVTGTGPNIGGEIARTFAANGARVVCLDARSEIAAATAKEISDTGAEALAVTADITSSDDVERAVQDAVSTFGGLDVLVNNAAISPLGSLIDTKMEDWHAALNVILTGTFLCSRFAAKQMIAQNTGGVIINIASTSGHRGKSGHIAYATAKGGVLQLTRCMAMELAAHGIRVNSVSPNSSGTPLAGSAKSREGKPPRAPLGRWGRTTDQAQAVVFMASSNADFITGTDLAVDGGVLAGRP
ncbi:MAG: SDR family oxidoreductase [Actinobacteria bacterium]|nr:SDR family oxidoreductase [Actinophytocola sp.]MQB02295.1 SDR family oxidoreductase [Actinomycetota bacterium]